MFLTEGRHDAERRCSISAGRVRSGCRANREHGQPLGIDDLAHGIRGVVGLGGAARRDARPTAYSASSSQLEVDDLTEEPVGDLDEDAGAVAGVDLGARTSTVLEVTGDPNAPAERRWLRVPSIWATKDTPHASCSLSGE